MQTFLPWASFEKSASCLDWRRLGKQRIEARQLVNTLEGISVGWKNHPACIMWRGYTVALKEYYNVICREWISRGYTHNMGFYNPPVVDSYPFWLGNEEFHLSHRSNLLRKDRKWYESYFEEGLKDDLPYIWPKP